jgi:hypothetical protein
MSSILQLIVRITLCYILVDGFNFNKVRVNKESQLSMAMDFQPGDADILVRAFRGEDVERYTTVYSPPTHSLVFVI